MRMSMSKLIFTLWILWQTICVYDTAASQKQLEARSLKIKQKSLTINKLLFSPESCCKSRSFPHLIIGVLLPAICKQSKSSVCLLQTMFIITDSEPIKPPALFRNANACEEAALITGETFGPSEHAARRAPAAGAGAAARPRNQTVLWFVEWRPCGESIWLGGEKQRCSEVQDQFSQSKSEYILSHMKNYNTKLS